MVSLVNNGVIVQWGMVAATTTLPVSYTGFYSIAFAQADQGASAHVGRTIWLSSQKTASYFIAEVASKTSYITVGF